MICGAKQKSEAVLRAVIDLAGTDDPTLERAAREALAHVQALRFYADHEIAARWMMEHLRPLVEDLAMVCRRLCSRRHFTKRQSSRTR